MSPQGAAAAVRRPVRDLDAAWSTSRRTLRRARVLELSGWAFYIAGRGGALGDEVGAELVIASMGLVSPDAVRAGWKAAQRAGPARVAASRLAECARWGGEHLDRLPGVARLVELAQRVVEEADATAMPLFAGTRAMPRPGGGAGAQAAVLAHLLHEQVCAAILIATRACGLRPVEALIAGPDGEQEAMAHGWHPPFPARTPLLRRYHYAEALADRICGQAWSGLSAAERAELVSLVAGAAEATIPRREPQPTPRRRGENVARENVARENVAPDNANLPAGWSIGRPTLADVPEILAVVHASDIAAVGEPDFTAEEVVEILQAPNHDPDRDSWLARDASGRVMGWAYIHNPTGSDRDNIDDYAHPEHGVLAQAPLLQRVLARVAERAVEFGHPSMTARAGAIASETRYIALLRAAGFEFVKQYARMRRELGEEPWPVVPDGVTVRPVRHADETEMRTFHRILDAAFRDTPDYQPSDYDTFRRRLAALPEIAWDEWLIAEVTGVPAAVLQSAGDVAEQNEGWVKNLAVARQFRGRGLGQLLLRWAFATYRAKGRSAAGLGVDTTNPTGAYRLYESVGMTPLYRADVYERTVEPVSRS